MAINPLLVSIKQASDLETAIPTEDGFFFYYENGNLMKAPMNDIYEKINSGIKGTATQSNAPTPWVTGDPYLYEKWEAIAPITSPNSWGNIAVTQDELDDNFVYFHVTNGVVVKQVSPKKEKDLTVIEDSLYGLKVQGYSSIVSYDANGVAISAINDTPFAVDGYLTKLVGRFPATGNLTFGIAGNKAFVVGSAYTFIVREIFTVPVNSVGVNEIDLTHLKIKVKADEYLVIADSSTSKPYFGEDATHGVDWYQSNGNVVAGSQYAMTLVADASFAIGFEVFEEKYERKVKTTRIVATHNAGNYNAIRDIVTGISDASEFNQYEVFVPKGTWPEIDWKGKKWVKIIGESRDETIINLDPLGTMSAKISPADYSYAWEAGKALNTINSNALHIAFPSKDIHCENMTFFAKNSKYPLHIDNLGFQNANFINCRIKEQDCAFPIGIGAWSGQEINFDNCIIEPLTSWRGFFYHNWNNQAKPNSVTFNRSKFVNCEYGLIDELGSDQDDWVKLLDCFTTISANGGSLYFMVDEDTDGKTFWTNPATGVKESNPVNVPYSIKLNTTGTKINTLTASDSASFNVAWTGTPQRDINIIKEKSIINI